MIGDANPQPKFDLYDSLLGNDKIKSFNPFHTNEIRFLKYLSMNGYVASSSDDRTVNIWNPYTGESIRKYAKHSGSVYQIDQIDLDILVSGSGDKTIHIWKISTGELVYTIKQFKEGVISIKSLSNGLIAYGLDDIKYNINIYNYLTNALVKTLIGHSGLVNSIEKLNEQFLVSGSSDSQVIIWNLTSQKFKYKFSEHKNVVRRVKRLSTNLMASGDDSGLIIIWNWLSGFLVYKLIGHNSYVLSLDLYDDQTLISGSWDKTIKLWNISNGQLIKTINNNFEIKALVLLNRGKYYYPFTFFLIQIIPEFALEIYYKS